MRGKDGQFVETAAVGQAMKRACSFVELHDTPACATWASNRHRGEWSPTLPCHTTGQPQVCFVPSVFPCRDTALCRLRDGAIC